MRTIIQIEEQEVSALDALCKKKGWSRAKGIRESIRLMLKMYENVSRDDIAFGLWQNKKIEGVAYQKMIRKEWE